MATRVGLFCFRHRWWVLAFWLVIMTAGSLTIGPVFSSLSGNPPLSGSEASYAQQAIKADTDQGAQLTALVEGIDAQSTANQATLGTAVDDLRAISGIASVSRPQTASDGRGVAIYVTTAKSTGSVEHVAILAAVARINQLSTQIPGSTVLLGGGDSISNDANNAVEDDLNQAEYLSLPITLIVMIFIFGGLAAAGVPILIALATMAGAFGALLGFSHFLDLGHDVITVVTLLGLGLSIDYGLLLVARYREELARTGDRGAAIERAWGTAGRTILFSGLTVAGALTGLLVFQVPRLQGMGAAGISVAVVALLAGLTLTAALIGVFARWIKPSTAALARAAETSAGANPGPKKSGGSKPAGPTTVDSGEHGFFAGLARFTQRFPVLVVLGCVAVLGAIALPLLTVTIKVPQLEALPRSIESVQVADNLINRYGQTVQPAVQIVARTDPATLDSYAARWGSDPEVSQVAKARALGPNVSAVVLSVRDEAQGPQARDLVARVRADRPAGVESWVVGDAANLVDLNARLRAGLPWAAGITLLVMLVLLFLMTGSVVMPLKAVVMNVLSLGATLGVLAGVFQHGWLSGPLHTLTVGGLNPFVIVIVFAFAFGLSMDYEVFLLNRIKEQYDAGQDAHTAVRQGLQRSGRIITSAALLMLIVFACFAAAQVGQVEEIGLGLFVAVLIDATIVRCLLVPATLTLLGRAAWWAPGPLRRLHDRFGLTETPSEPVDPASRPQPVQIG